MKILYFSNLDIKNNKSWSGIPNSIYKVLTNNNNKVHVLVFNSFIFRALNFFQKFVYFIFNSKGSSIRGYFPNIFASIVVKMYAYIIKPEIIFSPTTILFRYIKKSSAINIALCDLLIPGFLKYYKDYYNEKFYKNDLIAEGECLENIDYLITPTNWSKKQISNFKIKSKPIIIKSFFGSNLKRNPKLKEVFSMVNNRILNKQMVITTTLQDKNIWFRKGVDITIDFCKSLKQKGHDVKLCIIGEVTEAIIDKLKISNIRHTITGKLDKSKKKDQKKFHTILSVTTFFFLPSRGEAYGISVCEAMAFGVPCFVSNNGGISEIILDNKSGKIIKNLKILNKEINYCEKLFLSKTRYFRFCLNAKKRHDKFLNWQSFYETSFKNI
jgi:glycosyltransferase involved in cell wall biosynthesis|tara:strand:- start:2503 stop:3651 length:1149 start_codon:yes stop_codon:yes gene_type:complete